MTNYSPGHIDDDVKKDLIIFSSGSYTTWSNNVSGNLAAIGNP